MEVRLESGRLVLYKAAWLMSQGRHPLKEASMAKLYVSEAMVQTCLDAIQIHGGYGYMTEYEMERELRDAISGNDLFRHLGNSEGHHRRLLRTVIVLSSSPKRNLTGAGSKIMAYVLQQLLSKSAKHISGKTGGLGARQEHHLPRIGRALEPAGASAARKAG